MENEVSAVLDSLGKVRRAFGPNRGLLIILLAIWSGAVDLQLLG